MADHSNPFRTVLFDLDGTLIDHFNVIFRCYEYALEKLGCAVPGREVLRATVGRSMEVTMSHFVDESGHPEAVRLFRDHFARIFLEDITVYPGVEWILHGLRGQGRKLAVFTNKQGEGSRRIIRHLGLDAHLDAVIGALDTPHHKPAAAFSRYALEKLETPADRACLVGDSVHDVEAARNGGFPCFGVTTGTHSHEALLQAGAGGVFSDLYALGHEVFGLDPAAAPPAKTENPIAQTG